MIGTIPNAIAFKQNDASFIQSLQHLGIKDFYANYWICYRLMFTSKEQLICGGRDRQLQPTGNRYLLYHVVVDNDPHAAYIYVPGESDDLYFAQKLHQLGILYRDFHLRWLPCLFTSSAIVSWLSWLGYVKTGRRIHPVKGTRTG